MDVSFAQLLQDSERNEGAPKWKVKKGARHNRDGQRNSGVRAQSCEVVRQQKRCLASRDQVPARLSVLCHPNFLDVRLASDQPTITTTVHCSSSPPSQLRSCYSSSLHSPPKSPHNCNCTSHDVISSASPFQDQIHYSLATTMLALFFFIH